MAPVAGHDEIGEFLTTSGRQFALFELVGQGMGIAGIADRNRGDGLPVFGDMEDFARFVGIKACHLMDIKTVGDRLEAKLCARAADIVESVRIGLSFFVLDLRDRDYEYSGMLRPTLIELDHGAQ